MFSLLGTLPLLRPIVCNCKMQRCIHDWGTTIGTMTPFCLVSWVLKQNECCQMLNNESRICTFKLSTNKCYNEWFKSIEHILNVLFKYEPKRNIRLNECMLWCRLKNYHNLIVFNTCGTLIYHCGCLETFCNNVFKLMVVYIPIYHSIMKLEQIWTH